MSDQAQVAIGAVSTGSLSKDQEWFSHMGEQVRRDAPARRITWATPPVRRKNSEVHTFPSDQPRETRARVATSGDADAGLDPGL